MKWQRGKNRSPQRIGFGLSALTLAFLFFLPQYAFTQQDASVSNFKVLKGFKSIKLTWDVSPLLDSKGVLEIYRSSNWGGPYVLIQAIQIGDRTFIDGTTETYFFIDRKVKTRHRYYYKLSVHGTGQEYGPLEGLVSGAPPGT